MAGRILVLDDSDNFRRELANVLEQQFEVVIVTQASDAAALCEHWLPDAVVLDMSTPQAAIEACFLLSAQADMPIIVAADDLSLDAQMAAYEAGATDTLNKPVHPQPLLYKVQLAIQHRRRQLQLLDEQALAEGIRSSLEASRVLMQFVRASIRSKNYEDLAERLAESLRHLRLSCFGALRRGGHDGEAVYFRNDGIVTPLEQSVIAKLSTMGQVFQFRSQLAVNFPQVSIVVVNVPKDDAEKAQQICDNVALLAETADALCENVQMRQNAGAHAEQLQLALMQANSAALTLRDEMRGTLLDTRLLLQELEDNVNRAHSWLGTTADQEAAISRMMDESIQKILVTISRTNIDEHMSKILSTMSGNGESTNDVELF